MENKNSKDQSRIIQKIIELGKDNSHPKNKLQLLGTGILESVFTIPEKQFESYSIKDLLVMYLQTDESDNIININTIISDHLDEFGRKQLTAVKI